MTSIIYSALLEIFERAYPNQAPIASFRCYGKTQVQALDRVYAKLVRDFVGFVGTEEELDARFVVEETHFVICGERGH